jgi:hypothetical protein
MYKIDGPIEMFKIVRIVSSGEVEMQGLNAVCPVCEADIPIEGYTEDSEILYCWDCSSRLITHLIENQPMALHQAPPPEDDWAQ